MNGRIRANMQREIRIPDNVMAIIDGMMRAGVGREAQLYYLAREHKIVLTVTSLRKKHRHWCKARGMNMPKRVVTNEMRDKMSASTRKVRPDIRCSKEERRQRLGLVPVRFDWFEDEDPRFLDVGMNRGRGAPKEPSVWL